MDAGTLSAASAHDRRRVMTNAFMIFLFCVPSRDTGLEKEYPGDVGAAWTATEMRAPRKSHLLVVDRAADRQRDFRWTGARMRTEPLVPERVKAAILARA